MRMLKIVAGCLLFIALVSPQHLCAQGEGNAATNGAFAQLEGLDTSFDAFRSPPRRIPDVTPNPNYPLRLHVESSSRATGGFGSDPTLPDHLRGVGYLDDGASFIYTGYCHGTQLQREATHGTYQARWLKTDERFEILALDPRSGKSQTCSLKVDRKATLAVLHSQSLAPPQK